MPQLPHCIELHDSTISGIELTNGAVLVHFSHAYIHNDGKGWSRKAVLTVFNASLELDKTSFPAKVDDGHMQTKLGPYHNLLNLPFDTDGNVKLEIEFFSGAKARIEGDGIKVVFTTEPEFIEDVP